MHEPVLVGEVVALLGVKRGGTYVDGTVGSGGHALAILERVGEDGFLLGIDRDAEAVRRASERLSGRPEPHRVVHGNFARMGEIVSRCGLHRVDGVLLDLGVSSEQLDQAGRGFSLLRDGPLDMRMDASEGTSARDAVNSWPEEDLAAALRQWGEEPRARAVARAIVRERQRQPIETTGRLAEIVESAAGPRRGRLHPATRAFQAIRMAVNDEMGCLDRGLDEALSVVSAGGRIAVISFHRLEDRKVKTFFAEHVGRWESLAAGGRQWRGALPRTAWVNRKPVTPSEDEVRRNPRARSAKLRVAERVAES